MPTAASATFTANPLQPQSNPDLARVMAVNLPASIKYAKGTLLGEVTATPGTYKAYTSGATDGSQIPTAVLKYDVVTDAAGLITFTSTTGQTADEFGNTGRKTAPVFTSGYFYIPDLVASGAGALDANALTTPGWRLIEGSIAGGTGIVALGV